MLSRMQRLPGRRVGFRRSLRLDRRLRGAQVGERDAIGRALVVLLLAHEAELGIEVGDHRVLPGRPVLSLDVADPRAPGTREKFAEKKMLGGSADPLVAYLAESEKLSAKDLATLRTIAKKIGRKPSK